MNVSVSTRLVVEYSQDGKQSNLWVPPLDKIQMIGDNAFVSLGYSGDKGCGDARAIRNK